MPELEWYGTHFVAYSSHELTSPVLGVQCETTCPGKDCSPCIYRDGVTKQKTPLGVSQPGGKDLWFNPDLPFF